MAQVIPSKAVEINKTAIARFLTPPSLEQCSLMSLDADGALVRELPAGGSLGFGPASVVGNFQMSYGGLAATVPHSVFSLRPPPIAHFVGEQPRPRPFGTYACATFWDI